MRVRSTDSDGVVFEEVIGIAVDDVQEIDDITDIPVGTAFYKDTSVNFINNTDDGAFWVQSADNRFERFLLNPGQSRRITDSIEGWTNSDINANIWVFRLEPGRKYDYAGNMRFSNAWAGSSVIKSDGKSFFSGDPTYDTNGLDYNYHFKNQRQDIGSTLRWRRMNPADASGLKVFYDDGFSYSKRLIQYNNDVVFQSHYFGTVNGQKRWDFVATELPSV